MTGFKTSVAGHPNGISHLRNANAAPRNYIRYS